MCVLLQTSRQSINYWPCLFTRLSPVTYIIDNCNSQFIMLHASIDDNRNTRHSFTLTSSILRYSIMTFPYNSCRCTSREYCIKHRSCSNSWSSTSTSSQLSTATAIHSHCLYLLTDTVDISTVINSLSLSRLAKMFVRSKTSHTQTTPMHYQVIINYFDPSSFTFISLI